MSIESFSKMKHSPHKQEVIVNIHKNIIMDFENNFNWVAKQSETSVSKISEISLINPDDNDDGDVSPEQIEAKNVKVMEFSKPE